MKYLSIAALVLLVGCSTTPTPAPVPVANPVLDQINAAKVALTAADTNALKYIRLPRCHAATLEQAPTPCYPNGRSATAGVTTNCSTAAIVLQISAASTQAYSSVTAADLAQTQVAADQATADVNALTLSVPK